MVYALPNVNMGKPKIVKCRYSSCLHESKELNADDAVRVGNSYYHKDCYQTKEQIKEIVDLFTKEINQNTVIPILQRTIKNIVFEKGLGSDFLLFGLKYYIENKIPLNYPQGLYYVIQNKNVQNEYQKQQNLKAMKEAKSAFIIEEIAETRFEHKAVKSRGFESILGK